MKFAIKCLGLAGIAVNNDGIVPTGAYLSEFDADAHEGMGHAAWSSDPNEAIIFHSPADAFRYWKTQSIVRPLRDDGHPNRPLTAFSVEIASVE